MKRLLKNKKGAIADTIGNLVQGIVQIIPAPLLFIIFLFLLFALSWVLSIVFLATGTFCNSANQPVKLNQNFLQDMSLVGQIPDPKILNLPARNLEETGITIISGEVTTCSYQVQAGRYITRDGKITNFTTPRWFYDGTFCTKCEPVTVYDNINGKIGGIGKTWCIKDAYKNEDKNLLQKAFCGSAACEPPQHYLYSSTQNLYLCADKTCETGTNTIGKAWDELLQTKGATLMYPNPTNEINPGSNNAIGITCQNLKPRLGVYGIDLFNFELWIFITLLILLIWAIINFR